MLHTIVSSANEKVRCFFMGGGVDCVCVMGEDKKRMGNGEWRMGNGEWRMENCCATVLHSPFFFLPIGVGSTNDKVQSTAKSQRESQHSACSAPLRFNFTFSRATPSAMESQPKYDWLPLTFQETSSDERTCSAPR